MKNKKKTYGQENEITNYFLKIKIEQIQLTNKKCQMKIGNINNGTCKLKNELLF